MGKLVGPRTGVRHVLADVSRHFVSRTGHRGPQEGYGDTDSDASLYAAVNTDIDTDTDLDAEISTDIDSTTDADSPGPRRPNTRWGRGRGVEGKGRGLGVGVSDDSTVRMVGRVSLGQSSWLTYFVRWSEQCLCWRHMFSTRVYKHPGGYYCY